MTKIHCCLCSRRTDTKKQRAKIGTTAFWPLFCVHAEGAGLDIKIFSREDYVCMKCHSSISHYGMDDRGPNRKQKVIKPFVFESSITKGVLRSQAKTIGSQKASSSEVSADVNQNNDALNGQSQSVNTVETPNSQIGTVDASATQTVGDDFDSNSQSSADDEQNRDDLNTESVVTVEIPSSQISTIDTSTTQNDFVLDGILSETVLDLTEIINDSTEKQIVDHTQHASVKLPDSSTIHLQGIKNTQSRCFVCQSVAGRKVIPWTAIQHAWFEKLCYIPKSNRICKDHLTITNKFTEECLETITESKQDVYVNNIEFAIWLHAISVLPKSCLYNFEEDGIEAERYKMLLGISKDNFDHLVQYLHGMRNTATRSLRTALAMFLMILRNNIKQEIIAFNFSTTQQVVSSTIDAVSAALEEFFVPKHLGYYHITREEALEKHSIKLTSQVLGQSEDRLCLIADCTYNYIEKPSDFELQRKTFSLHKKRNLLKPLYIVLPSGYILEAAGPYFCDANNNDAVNIRHHYKHSDLLLFLEEDDFFIFDRGFRDVVKETKENGHNVMMPALLGGKRTNFTCEEANDSRKVTMNRWVVEAVNARVKNVFPFFKHTIEGSYVPKIMRFHRIACAIINCYFPPLFKDKDFHDIILEETRNLTDSSNLLKEEIESLGIQRMTNRWEKANERSVPDFPELSMDDLKRLTLGTYQIQIAERYIDHHMKGDKQFGIFLHRENEGIIRAKIQSRFSRSKAHNAWVKYDADDEGFNAIRGLYCTCKVGQRTLGCCSHLTSVVRYLGYDRHQPKKVISHCRLQWDAIDCFEGDGSMSTEEEEDADDDCLQSENEIIDLNCR